MRKLSILSESELLDIEGGSEFSEWVFGKLGSIYGYGQSLHQAIQGASKAKYFGNAMYYK